jgi:hypothetical protein
LADHKVPEGEYFMPRLSFDANQTAADEYRNSNISKPWAQVSYHHSMENTFASNLIRGFIIDFLSAFFLTWILIQMRDLDFKKALLTSLAVGMIGYMTISYLDSVWF